MANELIPTSVTLTVDSVIQSVSNMTFGGAEYDRLAIVTFKTDRDDVRFVQTDDNTDALTAVTWYGMYLIPYSSSGVAADIEVKIVCAGIEKTVNITRANMLTPGHSVEISLSESEGETNVTDPNRAIIDDPVIVGDKK